MDLSERMRLLMAEQDLSQAELARRVGLSQPSIFALLNSNKSGSRHLHRIARALGTTPAYLTGETDDRDENAPPPLPEPTAQYVRMPVALPTEAALAAMFEAQLRVFDDLRGGELARALAKRLPSGLARLLAVPLYEGSVAPDNADAEREPQEPDRPAARQAQRR